MPQIEARQFNLTYPLTFDPYTFEQFTLPVHMGGFTLSEVGTVDKVEAVALSFFLDVTDDWQDDVGEVWERRFLETMTEAQQMFGDIEIYKFVSSTPAWEMENAKNAVTPILLINVAVMVIFCIIAANMSDVVRSKPFIGFLGLFTAINATIAGFGLSCYLGVEFIALNYAAPFLLLGIGRVAHVIEHTRCEVASPLLVAPLRHASAITPTTPGQGKARHTTHTLLRAAERSSDTRTHV